MCDYSLHHVASRPAKVGDKLVTTQFNNSITRGFASVGEPNVAVCLLPGTEVAFEKEIEFERGFGLFSSWTRQKRIGDKVGRNDMADRWRRGAQESSPTKRPGQGWGGRGRREIDAGQGSSTQAEHYREMVVHP